jgi:hypothetical protein
MDGCSSETREGRCLMRKWLTLLWLLAGVAIFAYHYNQGQKQVQRYQAWKLLQEIEEMERAEDRNIDDILLRHDDGEPNSAPMDLVDALPEDESPIVFHQIRLKQARLRLEALDIATALDELYELLTEVTNAYGDDAPISRAVRESLGEAHYMAAWVLQGVGAPEKEWRPYGERARQIFRYLAEHNDPEAYREYQSRVKSAVEGLAQDTARK